MTTYGRNHPTTAAQLLQDVTTPLAFMEQTHGSEFFHITNVCSQTALGADAVITTQPNISLVIRHADCLPIEIRTPTCIAALHAGRKSTQLRLLQKVVQYIKTLSNGSEKMHITFGPRICVDCYQIDRETNTHYNLQNENYKQLTSELPPSAFTLQDREECTNCKKDTYFSYRGDGKGTPMNYSVCAGLQQR